MKKPSRTIRRPSVSSARHGRARLFVEMLEERTVPSNGEWLVTFDGLRGRSDSTQVADAADRLHAAGIEEDSVRVIERFDQNVVVVQTPLDVTWEVINKEMQDVRGFVSVQDLSPQMEHEEEDEDFWINVDVARSGRLHGGGHDQPPAGALDPITNNNNGSSGSSGFTQSETTLVAFGN